MNTSIFNHQVVRGAIPVFIVIWTAIILMLTLLPSESIPEYKLFDFDKLGHLTVFGGWTFLTGLFILINMKRIRGRMWKVALLGFFFGTGIEIVQYLAPINRSASIADAVANTIGCLLAWWILRFIQQDLQKNQVVL
jgi:glycopeptide antibiotics resistance protein